MVKTIHWIQHKKKKLESEKNNDKDGKALHKLMNSAIYEKTTENLRNRVDLKLVNNEKRLFKMYIKTKLHVGQNIWQ